MNVNKVKKTYGKRNAAGKVIQSENLKWKDDTFDKLLNDENNSVLVPSKRQPLRASFNRNSSLDESKIQQVKPKKARKASKKRIEHGSSPDSFYELYLSQKKKKENIKKKESASVRNVKVSTPAQRNSRKKAALAFEVSPIRFDDSVPALRDSADSSSKLYDSIRRERLQEIEDMKQQAESSAVASARALLDKHKVSKVAATPRISFNSHELNSPRPPADGDAAKKVVKFDVPAEAANAERCSLKPGKWRRSLIAWRKSHNEPDRLSIRITNISLDDCNVNARTRAQRLKSLNRASERLKILEESSSLIINQPDSVLLEQSDEGDLQAELSIIDASIKCATTFHDQRKTSQRQTSVFDRSSIFYGLQEQPLIDVAPVVSAQQIALRRCGQQAPLSFDEVYSESKLPNCCKIGEGVYGEVFMYKCPTTHQPIVLKIIPIEGDQLVNGEPQKRFDEILQEIVISMELSNLRHGKDFSTDGFVNVKRVTCVRGAYPQHLIDEWELYRDNRAEGSDNDHPELFYHDQLYVVFELCNGGKDLEAFIFNNAAEAQSVFIQTALTLAVAERKFEFEHRDLHWGNILIAPTTDKFTEFRFDGKLVKLLTHGVKVTIIDYSLSRMVYDGAVLFDNLARDEELFQSSGDYQFDIYRLMRERVENQFERYEPYTNLLWLHYIVDKLINGARYRFSKTKKHRAAMNEMMQERDDLLNFESASDYVSRLAF